MQAMSQHKEPRDFFFAIIEGGKLRLETSGFVE